MVFKTRAQDTDADSDRVQVGEDSISLPCVSRLISRGRRCCPVIIGLALWCFGGHAFDSVLGVVRGRTGWCLIKFSVTTRCLCFLLMGLLGLRLGAGLSLKSVHYLSSSCRRYPNCHQVNMGFRSIIWKCSLTPRHGECCASPNSKKCQALEPREDLTSLNQALLLQPGHPNMSLTYVAVGTLFKLSSPESEGVAD